LTNEDVDILRRNWRKPFNWLGLY